MCTMVWYTDGLLKEKIKNVSKNLYDIVLICKPLELKDDWVRNLDENLRKKVFNETVEYLKEIKWKIYFIDWNKEERLKKALNIVKKYI